MLDGRLKGLTLMLTSALGGKDGETQVAALIEPNYREWEIKIAGGSDLAKAGRGGRARRAGLSCFEIARDLPCRARAACRDLPGLARTLLGIMAARPPR